MAETSITDGSLIEATPVDDANNRYKRALLDRTDIDKVNYFIGAVDQIVVAEQQRLDLWDQAITDLSDRLEKHTGPAIPMMEGYATTVPEYLEIAQIQRGVIENAISTEISVRALAEWMVDENTQLDLIEAVYRKLEQRKSSILQSEAVRYAANIKRIFPPLGDRAEAPKLDLLQVDSVPSSTRWRKNKGIPTQGMASEEYAKLIKKSREVAIRGFGEAVDNITNDVLEDVESSDIQAGLSRAVMMSLGIYDEDEEAAFLDSVAKVASSELVTGEDDILQKWVLETDKRRKAQYLHEYKNMVKKANQTSGLTLHNDSTSRHLLRDEITDMIVGELEELHADAWKLEVKMAYEDVVADVWQSFAKDLDDYSYSQGAEVSPIQKQKRKSIGNQVARSAQMDTQPVPMTVEINLPWLDAPVEVEVLEIGGVKIGYTRGVAGDNEDYTRPIEESVSQSKVLREKIKLAQNYSVNGSWSIMSSVADADRDKYPWKIKKFAKHRGEGLRFYFTKVPASDNQHLQSQGVEHVLVFLGGCTKNKQKRLLQEFTGMKIRQLTKLGAGK